MCFGRKVSSRPALVCHAFRWHPSNREGGEGSSKVLSSGGRGVPERVNQVRKLPHIRCIEKLNVTRIVAISTGPQSFDLRPIQLDFLKGYAALLSGEPIQRTPDIEKFYEAVGTPQLVILDVRQFLRFVRILA